MNTKQLQYALILAREGSFSKAADVLNISQPSLSQYVKKIEKELGIELFDRVGGSVQLTDAGRAYINACHKILDIEHQMENELSDIKEYKTGTVKVGTSPFRSAAFMPKVVEELKKKYPGIHLVIDERGLNELIDMAENGEFDICVAPGRHSESVFVHEKIFDEELIFAMPEKFAKKFDAEEIQGRRYPAIDVAQLDGFPFIAITETQITQKALNELQKKNNITLECVAVVKSLTAQISMVRHNLGIALLPVGIEKFTAGEDGIVFFSLKQSLPKREIFAIYRKDRELSCVGKEIINILKNIKW